MNQNKIRILSLVAFMLVIILSSCSSNPSGQSHLGNNDNDKKNAHSIASAISEAQAENYNISNGIKKTGDTVEEFRVENNKIVPNALTYTIKKASLFSNFAEAGLSKDQMNDDVDPELFDTKGKLKSSVKFVVAEMTVKNLKASPRLNITTFLLEYSSSSVTSKKMEFLFLSYPSYFSNSINKNKGYWACDLAVGQSKDIKVGWYVDTEKYHASNLYLVFNPDNAEYRQILKLDL